MYKENNNNPEDEPIDGKLWQLAGQTDLYELFGINKDATAEDIKSAYRRLAKEHHPDSKGGDGDRDIFQQINNANEVLGNPDKRRTYDTYRERWAAGIKEDETEDNEQDREKKEETSQQATEPERPKRQENRPRPENETAVFELTKKFQEYLSELRGNLDDSKKLYHIQVLFGWYSQMHDAAKGEGFDENVWLDKLEKLMEEARKEKQQRAEQQKKEKEEAAEKERPRPQAFSPYDEQPDPHKIEKSNLVIQTDGKLAWIEDEHGRVKSEQYMHIEMQGGHVIASTAGGYKTLLDPYTAKEISALFREIIVKNGKVFGVDAGGRKKIIY